MMQETNSFFLLFSLSKDEIAWYSSNWAWRRLHSVLKWTAVSEKNLSHLRHVSSAATLKSILVLTDRDWLRLLRSDSGRGKDRFLGKWIGENCLMGTLVATGDEGLAWLSLGAMTLLGEVLLLYVFLGLCLGMLEGDDVHLTEKTKGKSGREKKVKLRRIIHNSEALRKIIY